MFTGDVTWKVLQHKLSNQARRERDCAALSVQMADEFQDVFDLHDGDHTAVAMQLFQVGEVSQVTAGMLAKVQSAADLLDELLKQAPRSQSAILKRWS